MLEAGGIRCLVCAPDSSRQKAKRRKNNSLDARTLAGNLFNYLAGNRAALQLVRIPTAQQEQQRAVSRQEQDLVKDRKRLAARGNSLLIAQGYGSWKNWWRPKTFARLSQLLPQWIKELLENRLDELQLLDKKIGKAKLALARRHGGPRPKGAGAVSLVQLKSEVLDWNRYSSARKIGCLSGMVPSEWSTGNTQRLGPITKVGVPAIRRIATEMAWRIIRFQPDYRPVKKWRSVLEGNNRALKKKAVVAITRQLLVDLWRLETGRISAAELGLVMVSA